MGMSTHVAGVIPPDDEFNTNLKAWIACKAAGVAPPKELYEKLGVEWGTTHSPDPKGVVVHQDDDRELATALSRYFDDTQEGYDIDLSKLPKKYKIIRVYNSW